MPFCFLQIGGAQKNIDTLWSQRTFACYVDVMQIYSLRGQHKTNNNKRNSIVLF